MKRLIPRGRKKFLIISALFLGLIVIPKSITVVPAGHVGLKDFFGNVSDKTPQREIETAFNRMNE